MPNAHPLDGNATSLPYFILPFLTNIAPLSLVPPYLLLSDSLSFSYGKDHQRLMMVESKSENSASNLDRNRTISSN
jgi:hypothetical protein